MCSFTRGALVGVLIAFANSAAFANEPSNVLRITANDPLLNSALLTVEGSGNAWTMQQTSRADATGANRIEISVFGDANGLGDAASPPPLMAALPWGTIVQSGEANMIGATITGEANLLAALQNGDGNRLSATIAGTSNQAAVFQSGASNAASFMQVGHGNMVSISQTSW